MPWAHRPRVHRRRDTRGYLRATSSSFAALTCSPARTRHPVDPSAWARPSTGGSRACRTVLFNSTLSVQDAVSTNRRNRIFGVNQGTVHKVHGAKYQGRGYFGLPSSKNGGAVASVWEDDDLARRLHLFRDDSRPGTTALLIGFYDPDRPEVGLKTNPSSDLAQLASELRFGVEESFWPLLSRGRLRVTNQHSARRQAHRIGRRPGAHLHRAGTGSASLRRGRP